MRAENIKPATSNDWKIELPSKDNKSFDVNVKFSSDQMEKINLGFKPKSMDDKWFIYKENNNLFFHRSWTGKYIMCAQFESSSDGATLKSLFTATEQEDQYDLASMALLLINNFLLNYKDH